MPTISEAYLKEFLKTIKDKPLEPNDSFYVAYFQQDNDPLVKLYYHITSLPLT